MVFISEVRSEWKMVVQRSVFPARNGIGPSPDRHFNGAEAF
jgi:hypothetical protein